MTKENTGPAWGYRAGEAKIFEDGKLPKGWVDSPAKVKPAKEAVNGDGS